MGTTNFDTVAAATFTGAVVGNVTGDVTGDVTGAVVPTINAYAANGAITIASQVAVITKGTAAAMTLAAPTTGTDDGVTITIASDTAAAHTITATTIGFNKADAAGDVATLGGAIGDGLAVMAYQGEWLVLNNINATIA